MTDVWRSISAALRTWPTGHGWSGTATELVWSLPLLGLLSVVGGFAQIDPLPIDGHWFTLLLMLFVVPALGEELIFRALLVPRPDRAMTSIRFLLCVGAFVAWHPLQAVTIGPPWATLFLNPWFLCATAVLGTALVRMYRATGSIWPCVATHWLVVAGWKLFLGGPFG